MATKTDSKTTKTKTNPKSTTNYPLIAMVIALLVALVTLATHLDEQKPSPPSSFCCDYSDDCPVCFQGKFIFTSECVEGFCKLCVNMVH